MDRSLGPSHQDSLALTNEMCHWITNGDSRPNQRKSLWQQQLKWHQHRREWTEPQHFNLLDTLHLPRQLKSTLKRRTRTKTLPSTNINNTSEQIPPSPARSTLYNSTSTAQSQPTMVQQIPPAPIVYQPPAIPALPVPAPAPFPTPRANITLQHYDGKSSAVQFWKAVYDLHDTYECTNAASDTIFLILFKRHCLGLVLYLNTRSDVILGDT